MAAIDLVSQSDALLSGDVERTAILATETAAHIIGCERVSVWLFDEAEAELRCIDLFEATPAMHSSGAVLRESEYGPELRAVKLARYVAADDPLTDARTAGYVDTYLRPLRITSMLDVSLHQSGRNFGLLCFEHVDRAHHWEPGEIEFAFHLADKIALALGNRARRLAEAKLRESESRFRRLVEATTDYIWEIDAQFVFTYVSPSMEARLGCTVGDRVTNVLWDSTPEDAARVASVLAVSATEPRPYSLLEATVLARDGARVILETSSLPLFDDVGRFIGYRGISRDVTARVSTLNELTYRDRLRRAFTECLTGLVSGESLAASVPAALAAIGDAVGADRLRVCQVDQADGTLRQSYEWHAADGPADQDCCMAAPEVRSWIASLAGSSPRPLVTRRRALIPIVSERVVIGYLDVDARARDSQWPDTELDSFTMLADVLAGLMTKDRDRAALSRSEEMFRAVTETAQDAIVMIDAAGTVCFWNRSAERMLGYSKSEAVGRDLHAFLAPEGYREKASAGMRAFAERGDGPVLGKVLDLVATKKDGSELPVELSVAPLTLGKDRFAVGILRDVSERKRIEAEMLRLARFDVLTGLANRGLFVEAAQHAIARARRGEPGFAVLYLDLDHFKDVNDTLGHPMGDRLLQGVADRLRSCARETDTVARFGGDEFAILQTGLRDVTAAGVLADKLVGLLAEPFSFDGNLVRTAASVGITVYGSDDPTVETLLGHADVALYRAKSEGRGTYRFFTDAMDADVRTRVRLGDQLRRGMAAGELFLVYQPQVDAGTGRIGGVEALVRWRHPERGVVAPGEFIAVAEQSGLIVALGEWVITEACRQVRCWRDEGLSPDVVAVNVSPLLFKAPEVLERNLLRALDASRVAPEQLELELTESGLMEASRDHSRLLDRLHSLGVRIAIDDFGTGYSSLDYSRRLPVNRIKIAQAFVSGITTAPSHAAIVKAALGLARELGLDSIADGVETARQCELLTRWGCRQLQGSYYSAPVAADDMGALLRRGLMVPAGADRQRP